ncbi:substrate-binding domain-containing protein [Primorskyibacter sp. 2E107]|uniref:substrate-binding domain-containing protein n=1 Tax=Primorskyibacter sp. 2E107 TaxID=3403458 RepID=UPI003AF709AE
MTHTDFPPHDYLTVRELAALLRLKERKIYDLAASGAVPCSRATGKLLFPAGEVRAWLEQAQSGQFPAASTNAPSGTEQRRPAVFLGSHDPLLDWAIRQSGCGLPTFFDGSTDGLRRFEQGEGVAAGLHLYDAASGGWNIPDVERHVQGLNVVLIRLATRRRGLVYRPDRQPLGAMSDIRGLRVVPRQPGSGTDRLFLSLAERDGVALADVAFAEVARTEDDAVETVRRGGADVTFGLEAVAKGYGLSFTHLIDEEFALLVDRRAFFDAPLQTLLGFLSSEAFQIRAEGYGGYDIRGLGDVLWNA